MTSSHGATQLAPPPPPLQGRNCFTQGPFTRILPRPESQAKTGRWLRTSLGVRPPAQCREPIVRGVAGRPGKVARGAAPRRAEPCGAGLVGRLMGRWPIYVSSVALHFH